MVLTALATTVLISLAAQGVGSAAQAGSTSLASQASSSSSSNVTQNRYPQFGESNSDVVRLQQAMIVRGFSLKGGVDGEFSARTRATLRNLQKAVGLRATGAVDERTARFLGLITVARLTPETLPVAGDTGDAVWSVQQALINNGVEVKGGADAHFGLATTTAIASYQSRNKLPVTKTLTHATAFALGLVDTAPVVAPVAAPVTRSVVAKSVAVTAPAATATPVVTSSATQLSINALPSRGQSGDSVRLVQQTLINNGIEVKGGADGVFGLATSIALGNFQAGRGLHTSQMLDFPTAQALGLIPSLESLGIPSIQVFPVQGRCSFSNTWQQSRGTRLHEGVDIIAPTGNLIYAVVDGTITRVYSNSSLTGNGVRLTQADGTYFFYAHLDTIAPNIAVGTTVKAGQILGTNGATGNTGTAHLHFEVHPRGGAPIDPTPIVAAVNACHVTDARPQP